MSRIIAICGKNGSGKDTLALLLKNNLKDKGYKVNVYSISGPLKDICAFLMNLDLKEVEYFKNLEDLKLINENYEKKEFRDFIKDLANVVKKYLGENYFIDKVLQETDKNKNADFHIITGIRLINEVKKLKEKNAFIIFVESSNDIHDKVIQYIPEEYINFRVKSKNTEELTKLQKLVVNLVEK